MRPQAALRVQSSRERYVGTSGPKNRGSTAICRRQIFGIDPKKKIFARASVKSALAREYGSPVRSSRLYSHFFYEYPENQR